MVENQTNLKIKALRSDRGGEYMSHQFSDYCLQEGIRRELTTPYTPQQNGVSERKNRTLINVVITKLSFAKLPKIFWGEAILTANYLQNRSPTKSISTNQTPFEIWFKRQPNLSYLRIFGSKAYVFVPKDNRQKLDSHSTEAIFLGYDEQSKAYRLMDIKTRNIIISRDVIFDEKVYMPEFPNDLFEENLIDPHLLQSLPTNPVAPPLQLPPPPPILPPPPPIVPQPTIQQFHPETPQSHSHSFQPPLDSPSHQDSHQDFLEPFSHLSLEDATHNSPFLAEVNSAPKYPLPTPTSSNSPNPLPIPTSSRPKRNIKPSKRLIESIQDKPSKFTRPCKKPRQLNLTIQSLINPPLTLDEALSRHDGPQ